MKLFGVVGWSGSGKTVLVEKLIAILVSRDLKVSAIKHAHHTFDIDQPGKDSYRHRAAGAAEVIVASPARWAMIRELRGESEPNLTDLVARLAPADLVLIEGFKADSHDKLEVFDPAIGKRCLAGEDPNIVAVATMPPLPTMDVAVFDRNDEVQIADFITRHVGIV